MAELESLAETESWWERRLKEEIVRLRADLARYQAFYEVWEETEAMADSDVLRYADRRLLDARTAILAARAALDAGEREGSG